MGVSKGKILVVDDQGEMRKSLNRVLRIAAYEVLEAENGDSALVIFKRENPQLVLSDLRMPGMDGISLLHEIRKTSNVPFVLMTGFAEVLQSAEAYEMGVDGFLLKPFQQADLISTIESALVDGARLSPVQSPSESSKIKDQYCGIPVGEFIGGREIKFPIFLKLSDSKFVRIAYSGEDLSSEKVTQLQKKGLAFLYLQRDDFKKYISFASEIADSALANQSLSAKRKAQFLKHSSEMILEFGFQQYVDRSVFDLAKLNVEQSLSLLSDHLTLLELLDSLTSHSSALYSHSMGVALVACLTGRAIGWESSPLYFRLVSSAILHDIGKRELPEELQGKACESMTPDELLLWREHPKLGAECLQKIEDLPTEISQIVFHHHEHSDGSGFPNGLTSPKIHPVAKVIRCADEFFKLYIGANGRRYSPIEAIAILEKDNKRIGSYPKLEFIDALKKAFLPKE